MMPCAGRARRALPAALAFGLVASFPSKADCNQMDRPAFHIQAGPGLPFGDGELRRMVAIRLGGSEAAACSPVNVTRGAEAGQLLVACPGRRAEVWVGDRTGEDAARMVAIVLADLVTATTAAAAPRDSAPPALEAAPTRGAATAPQRLSLWVVPGAAWGTSTGTAFEPLVGTGWALSHRAGVALEAGVSRVASTPPKVGLVAAEVDMLPVRAGGTLTFGPATLAAGAVARVFRAHAGTAHLGVRGGGFVSGAWTFMPRWPVHPYVTAGLDVYAEKLEVRVDALVNVTAGRVSPWAGIGAVWSGARP